MSRFVLNKPEYLPANYIDLVEDEYRFRVAPGVRIVVAPTVLIITFRPGLWFTPIRRDDNYPDTRATRTVKSGALSAYRISLPVMASIGTDN